MDMSQTTGHEGVVQRIQGDEAVVRFQRSSMCAHCGACLAVGEKELEQTLPNTVGAKVGDRVAVTIAGSRVAQASILAYAIPLAFLILGVWLGSAISEVAALICGVAGCGIAYCVLRVLEKTRRNKNAFRPAITAILEPDEEGE